MEFIFYAQAAWICALWHSRVRRRLLISAQAAQIRLRLFFFMFAYTYGAYILCAGCGDPGLVSFWDFPGIVLALLGSSGLPWALQGSPKFIYAPWALLGSLLDTSGSLAVIVMLVAIP